MTELLAFIDTETSGLNDPHLLQLACRLVDSNRRYVGGFSYIVKPLGWGIEADAEAIHGISEAYAHKMGVTPEDALAPLYDAVSRADQVIGFNIQGFDRGVIRNAIESTGETPWWWDRCSNKMVDVMELAAPIMKLPGKFGDYKHPSLEEAARFFCPAAIPLGWKGHNADEDAYITEMVYWGIESHNRMTKIAKDIVHG